MRSTFVAPLLAIASILALAPLSSGCYVEAEPPIVAEGYTPQYYNGAIVYYDDGGRPYYYGAGGVVWIAPTDPLYVGYVNHWRTYRPAYARWNARYGARYHGYHRR